MIIRAPDELTPPRTKHQPAPKPPLAGPRLPRPRPPVAVAAAVLAQELGAGCPRVAATAAVTARAPATSVASRHTWWWWWWWWGIGDLIRFLLVYLHAFSILVCHSMYTIMYILHIHSVYIV